MGLFKRYSWRAGKYPNDIETAFGLCSRPSDQDGAFSIRRYRSAEYGGNTDGLPFMDLQVR